MRRFLGVVSLFFGFLIFSFIVIIGLLIYFNSPPSVSPKTAVGIDLSDDGKIVLEVRKGESALSVGKRLEETGVIRSRYFWILLSRVKKEYIKSGTYNLEIPISQIALHQILVTGRQLLIRVTIPEGVTLKKTARILADNGICKEEDFLKAATDSEFTAMYGIPGNTMEGYLFPDTYLFPSEYPAEKVIRTMADNFFNNLMKIEPKYNELNRDELNRKVIIASIVEREYRLEDEARLMAGVFYNRLDIGMALQSCATVEYVITEIQGRPHPQILYTRDIEIRDPYNTYIRPGLPPGPISNPGAAALNAAFNPEKSDYLYFRLNDQETGVHYFSKTLDDHIKAGLLYVKSSM